MREMEMRRAESGAESGREFERGGRRSAAAAVRGLLLKLAVCAAAAAAAASAQTAPVYRIEEVAFKEPDAPYLGERFTDDGLGCESGYYRAGYYRVIGYDGQRAPGDGGPASQAQLCAFRSMQTDGAGNIFILDNVRIRRIDAATGVIDTVVGKGSYYDDEQYYDDGFGERDYYNPHVVRDDEGRFVKFKDGAPAVEVPLNLIDGFYVSLLDVDAAGNIFFAVSYSRGGAQIYKVDAAAGTISHLAGSGRRGVRSQRGVLRLIRGEGGPAVEADIEVTSVSNTVADAAGNIFIGGAGGMYRIDAASGLIITVVHRESIVIGPDGEQQGASSFVGLGEDDDIYVWMHDVDSAGNPLISFGGSGGGIRGECSFQIRDHHGRHYQRSRNRIRGPIKNFLRRICSQRHAHAGRRRAGRPGFVDWRLRVGGRRRQHFRQRCYVLR